MSKKSVPPDRLPIGAFLKHFRIVKGPLAGGGIDEGWSEQGHFATDYPGWNYWIDLSEPKFCQKIKRFLKKESGWHLEFNNSLGEMSLHASHESHGKEDWDLASDDLAAEVGKKIGRNKTLLMFTDERVALARHHDRSPMSINAQPTKVARLR